MRLFLVFQRLLTLLSLGLAVPLVGRAESVDINVPAQRADRALLAFSQQAKIEILFSSDTLKQAQSASVVGRYESREALDRLLRGSGFVAQENGPGKYVVVRASRTTGSIRGTLRNVDGSPAKSVRVNVAGLRKTVKTDKQGAFAFEDLPPGNYQLAASATPYQPLILGDAKIEPGVDVTLDPQTLQPASDPAKLAPFLVLGESETEKPYNRRGAPFPPRTALGNIDLPRTENDVLPYTIYDRDQILRSGVANLNAFLQRELLDGDSGSTPPEANGSLSAFTFGSGNLKLRGYGEDETVVLVNGRRLPEVVNNLSSVQDSYRRPPPDVNMIPLSLVDRVEVLPVAASALYSGNPVGGVINIILRPEANATEVTSTYTNALSNYDAAQSTVSLQQGQTLLNGALRVRFNATFTKTTPPTERELGYIQANQRTNSAFSDLLGRYRATPSVSSVSGAPLFGPGTASFTSVAPGANGLGGLAAFTGREGVNSTGLYDGPGGFANSPTSLDYSYGRLQNGATYFGSVSYDVLPWLEVGLDGKYSNLRASRGTDVLFGDLFVDANSPFNPFGQAVKVSLNDSAAGLGNNYSESRLDSYSGLAALLVKLPRQWRVSLDGQYSHSITRYRGLVTSRLDGFQNLVDAGLYNPLRDTQVFAPGDKFYDQLLFYGSRGQFATLGSYETFDTALRLSNRSVWLPTGRGAISVGADYRLTRLGDYDWNLRYGDGTLLPSSTRLEGRTIERVSTFGELQGPLLPQSWMPRGLRSVEFDVAARYVTADTSEETHVAPTGGIKIELAGGLAFRATVATSNRFPSPLLSRSVSTIVAAPVGPGGGEQTFQAVNDPLRHGVDGKEETPLVTATEAITPNLKPEAAVTRTTGLVFQRGHEHRVRVSLDFTDTEKSGELTALSAQQVVDFESALPGRVVRAQPAAGDSQPGRIVSVLTGTFNLARRHSQNWSTSVDYSWTQCFGGQLDLYGRWAYFQRYDLQLLPNSSLVDELDHPDNADLKLLKHRVNFGTGWSNRYWGLTFDGHYFHSRKVSAIEQTYQLDDHISPYWQFDGGVQADVSQWLPGKKKAFDLRVQLRVNNLFDSAPPRYAADPLFTGVQSYGDWRGRVYSLSLSSTF